MVRKLALPDEILLKVEKPARYIGGEVNAVCKNFDEMDINFCMCFPDVYEIGMSHLGIQILYDMFNKWDKVYCDRVYSPWPDMDKIMRDRDIPLFAVESQRPLKDFDFLGITLQYEMCYTNILQILDLGKIPLYTADRTEDDPIIIGGGPCTYNPEPIADFFDLEVHAMFWWIVKIALWALAGLAASRLMKSEGSLLWNVLLGLAGGAVGSLVAGWVGIRSTNTLGSLIISVGGACLVIALARYLLPKFKH